jgi:hypothetical protein
MLDEIDQQILNGRVEQYNEKAGPRVGDWVLLVGEKEMRRLTYDWGDSIQTGCVAGDSGSFYLGNGYISYSGALDPSIPKAELIQVDETRGGRVWIFHRDFAQAGGGVEASIPFRVFKQIVSQNEGA